IADLGNPVAVQGRSEIQTVIEVQPVGDEAVRNASGIFVVDDLVVEVEVRSLESFVGVDAADIAGFVDLEGLAELCGGLVILLLAGIDVGGQIWERFAQETVLPKSG